MGAAVKFALLLGVVALLIVSVNSGGAPESSALSGWSVPVNLGPGVNSGTVDGGPTLSEDGLTLFFGSRRAGGIGGVGDNDIWVSQRALPTDPWGPPANVGAPINSASFEQAPSLSRDGHWLFLNSDRPGSLGENDVWVSYREDITDNFGWQTPVNLGAGVNSASIDQGAFYFKDESSGVALLYFGSNRPGGLGLSDIYVSAQLPDGSFGPGELVEELSSPFQDLRAVLRSDGLEAFLFSDRPEGLRDYDIWVSTRESVSDPWTPPVNLGAPVNTDRPDQQPWLPPDRRTLYLSSLRPGGIGGLDLYVTTRANRAPEPRAGGPIVGFEGSPTTFDASDSRDPDGDPLQFRWDFTADGTWDTAWSSSPTATHPFGDDWTGTAQVEVTDGDITGVANATVTIQNIPPSPSVDEVTQESARHLLGHFFPLDPITFTASAADPGSDDLSFAWEFGDRTSLTGGTYFNDGLGPDPPNSPDGTSFAAEDSAQHAYDLPGDYVVRLTARDDDGGEATAEFPIHVSSAADLKRESIQRIKALKEQALDHGDWRFVDSLDDAERFVWKSLGYADPFRPIRTAATVSMDVSVARNRGDRVDLVLGALWTPRLRGYDSLRVAWGNGDVTTVDLPAGWPARPLRYDDDVWVDAWEQDLSVRSTRDRRTGQVTLGIHAHDASLGFTLSLDADPVAILSFTYDLRPWWIDGSHLAPKYGHKVFQNERKAVDCLVTSADRDRDDDEDGDRDGGIDVLHGDDDRRDRGDCRDRDEDDDDDDDDDRDDESSDPREVRCRLNPRLWSDAERAKLDAECDAIANLLVKADEILARIPLEEARDTPVRDPRNQGRFDRELGRAERALARAQDAWDHDEHDDAIRHFEMAWEHARRAMRLAIR